MPTVEELRRLLRFDGKQLIWKERDGVPSNWNSKYAGKPAGTIDSKGYGVLTINGHPYKAHRVIWAITYGEWPDGFLDHANGDPSDNRIANLRTATPTQNVANRRNYGNRSMPKGVRAAYGGRFTAAISRNRIKIHLGTFSTAEEAHSAYKNAATEMYGEFARFE